MKTQYRTDIDGLRAIAVIAVLFFHTDIPGFSGGFVGVDIFFVISGFLITTIILKEIKVDNFSIVRFYERRIRRIFPALFPVIAFVFIVGGYLFTTTGYSELNSSITSTTLFYSNIFFMLKSGYFEPQSLQRPLLHTWSLAVEEQFYVFFPLSIILINKFFRGKYLPWLITIGIISLFASIYGISHHPSATFYLVPTRAWELLAGSILALGILPTPSAIWLRNILSITGIVLITYSVAFYSESTPFPGLNAIPPVLGAALIIYSNLEEKSTTLSKLFSIRPLVFTGLISYSLYLWHWPFVAFTRYCIFRPLNTFENVGIILASFIAATFSWRYIERPFRGKNMLIPDRNALFAFSGILMAAVTGLCLLIQFNIGKDKTDEWAQMPEMQQIFNKSSFTPIIGMNNLKPSFALWGDSHARALIPGMDAEAKLLKISGVILTHDGTPPLLGIDITTIPNNNPCNLFDEALFNTNVLNFIKSHEEIKTVFLSARWAADTKGMSYKQENSLTYILNDANGEYTGKQPNKLMVKVGLTRTVHALLDMGRKVIIVTDVPEIGYNVPRFNIIQQRLPIAVRGLDIRPSINEYTERSREVQDTLNELAILPNVTLIHPESKMFDANGLCRIINNGKLLYFDDNHLSSFGSAYVSTTFDKSFKEIARNSVN